MQIELHCFYFLADTFKDSGKNHVHPANPVEAAEAPQRELAKSVSRERSGARGRDRACEPALRFSAASGAKRDVRRVPVTGLAGALCLRLLSPCLSSLNRL